MKEEWRPIAGYEGCYEVSNLGRVRSLDRPSRNRCGPFIRRGRILKPYRGRGNGGNRYGIGLSRNGKTKTAAIHNLVLDAFVGPRPAGMECRHLDGDPGNNTISNIQWDSHSENMKDKVRHGTVPVGERAGSSTLTNEQVRWIMRLRGTLTRPEIAKRFGTTTSNVCSIHVGRTWSHLFTD